MMLCELEVKIINIALQAGIKSLKKECKEKTALLVALNILQLKAHKSQKKKVLKVQRKGAS